MTAIIRRIVSWFGFGRATAADSFPAPFPREWQAYLRRYVWQYAHLRDGERRRMEEVVQAMVARRRWTGGSGFEVTDEMRVAIAGRAAVMTLWLDEPYYFPHVPEIIVYPKPFYASVEQVGEWSIDPIFGIQAEDPRLGEAWHRGPLVLAWSSITESVDSEGYRTNVVVHEFAHHLDGLDGDMSGTPPMPDWQAARDWYRVTELDFLELVGRADRNEATLLDHYGATNRAEFFAVAAECFFDRPHALREQHPHLYDVLARYFRQSPADLLPRQSEPPARPVVARQRRKRRKAKAPSHGDPFTLGLAELQEGDLSAAIASFSAAIRADATDAEAYASRALAYLLEDRFEEAIADAEAALELDADDDDALAVRGTALVLTGKLEPGIADLRTVCLRGESPMARQHLGYAYLSRGEAKRAVHELNIALAIDPYDAQSYAWRAAAYRELGDENRAASDQEKALRLDPELR